MKDLRQKVASITDQQLEEFVFCSWGHYDRRQLKRDCKLHGIKFPFRYHVSLKHDFADRRKVKPMGLGKALDFFGLQFEGTPHRGIDDAANIARVFIKEWSIGGLQLREDHRVTDDMR